ncbi:hypothetical protein [Nonomuraea sp. NPDC005650]
MRRIEDGRRAAKDRRQRARFQPGQDTTRILVDPADEFRRRRESYR